MTHEPSASVERVKKALYHADLSAFDDILLGSIDWPLATHLAKIACAALSTPPARPGREDLIRIIKAEIQKHGANAGVRSGEIAMDAASQILAIFDGAGA